MCCVLFTTTNPFVCCIERLEELHQLLEKDKREFTQIKKEKDDIESGKADDRLDELEREIEE